jgi:hypothetical protein
VSFRWGSRASCELCVSDSEGHTKRNSLKSEVVILELNSAEVPLIFELPEAASAQVHLRRSGSGVTYCGCPLSSVCYIETTSHVTEQGAGAGTGVTCERCADSYRAAQTHARTKAQSPEAPG